MSRPLDLTSARLRWGVSVFGMASDKSGYTSYPITPNFSGSLTAKPWMNSVLARQESCLVGLGRSYLGSSYQNPQSAILEFKLLCNKLYFQGLHHNLSGQYS